MKIATQLLIIALAFASNTTLADALKDPTLAPAIVDNGMATGNADAIAALPVLQSVMLGAQYRAAIINGQKVLLGKKYEQATLIKLSEHSATLRNADGTTQILEMDYVGMKKNTVTPTETSVKKITSKRATSKQAINNTTQSK